MHKLVTLRYALPIIAILVIVTVAAVAVLFSAHIPLPGTADGWPQ